MGVQPPVYKQLVSALYGGISRVYYGTSQEKVERRKNIKSPRISADLGHYVLEWTFDGINANISKESISPALGAYGVRPRKVTKYKDAVTIQYYYTNNNFFNEQELRKRPGIPDDIREEWSTGKMKCSYGTRLTAWMISEMQKVIVQEAEKQLSAIRKLINQNQN